MSIERRSIAEPLAIFLKVLHARSIDKCLLAGIKYDQICRLNVKSKYLEVKDRLEYLLMHSVFTCADAIIDFYQKHINTVVPNNFVLAHGDLYAKHLIVNKNKQLVGSIDWGDSELLHPAIDLAIVYQFLPKEAHQQFWDVYGVVGSNTHTLAILRAIYSSVTISWYAHQVNDMSLMREGILSLHMINESLK